MDNSEQASNYVKSIDDIPKEHVGSMPPIKSEGNAVENQGNISSSPADRISSSNQNGITSNIDETKVDVAVHFLKNSNMIGKERESKEVFLASKGLTSDEIELSFRRAAESENVNKAFDEDTSWSFFDYVKSIAVGAGILSAVNYAYNSYILPHLVRESNDDTRLDLLEESFRAVKDDIKQNTYELSGTLKQMQSLMEEHQKSLRMINSSLKKDSSDPGAVTDLKTELSTIKSMMLSRNQFPATPYNSLSSKVNEIPAWQRISEELDVSKNAIDKSRNKIDIDFVKTTESSKQNTLHTTAILATENLPPPLDIELDSGNKPNHSIGELTAQPKIDVEESALDASSRDVDN